MEALTAPVINKILHDPLTLLKQKNEEAMADLYLDALRTLFKLPAQSAEISDEEEEKED